MPSTKSKIINFLLRNRHLMRFHLKPEVWNFSTSIDEYRQLCESGATRMKIPAEISIDPVEVNGIHAEWIKRTNSDPDGVILFVHGGGYVAGSCSDHRGHVAKVVQGTGVNALLFDYRLAPEHPFPAGLDDTLTVYRWLINSGMNAEKIVIVGDSAGGGLSLAALLAIGDTGLPLPAGAVAVSPWTDLKLTGESHKTKTRVCLSPAGISTVCSKYYCGKHDPEEPCISPLYGDLTGLPPLLIMVGDDETLRDDSTRFVEKAKLAGVEVTIIVEMGQVHCYPFLAPLFPEAVKGMAEICSFIQQRISPE
jgi:epsilon-lactone hydrolase